MSNSADLIPRVVISGVGGITSLGVSASDHMRALTQGSANVTPSDELAIPFGYASSFDPKAFIKDRKSIRMMTSQVKLGMAAATLAFEDTGSGYTTDDSRRAVFFGACFTQGVSASAQPYMSCSRPGEGVDYEKMGAESYREYPPLWVLPRLPNTTGGQIAIQFGLRAISYSVVNGPAGGLLTLGEAYQAIQDDRIDLALVGATENEVYVDYLFRMSQHYPLALQKDQTGFIGGEGAAALVVERLDQAQARDAKIYAEVLGYQNSYLANIDNKDTDALTYEISRALKGLLDNANLAAADIDAVQITQCGIEFLDSAEARAVHQVFGSQPLIVSSTAYTGFTFGAASACSLMYACMQLEAQQFAPVLNPSSINVPLSLAGAEQARSPVNTLVCLHVDYLGNLCGVVLSKGEQV
uniref:beta-ketoacyl synthase N-terminal-like domain-containing protein n=1 Tax=Thaumasiovibrio occultus TaxID=1891184 RepID=UPI000B362DF1|nr:beta-ketoacyl synthase N-terminal-like domain-containing protein [Thaumasiovibrio occultus]